MDVLRVYLKTPDGNVLREARRPIPEGWTGFSHEQRVEWVNRFAAEFAKGIAPLYVDDAKTCAALIVEIGEESLLPPLPAAHELN